MAGKEIEDNEIYSSTGATKINPIRIVNEDTPDVPAANQMGAWIDEQLKHYERMNHRDELLWDDFRADFARWQIQDFKKMSQNKRGELRSFLRNNGVYVTMKEVISHGLNIVLDEKTPAEWPDDELMKISKASKNFNSWENPRLKEGDSQKHQSEPQQMSGTKPAKQEDSPSNNPANFQGYNENRFAKYPSPDIPFQELRQSASIPDINERGLTRLPDSGRGIQTLSKIYQKEDKYCGEEDVLDVKLLIFYANCYAAGVTQKNYPAAFSTMLTGKARTFYFNKVAGNKCSFEDVVNLMKSEFETEQRQERITTEWENTRLEEINKRHPEKTLLENFEMMRKNLINVQAMLRPELHSDRIIRDKLYRACRNVSECKMALFKRSDTFQEASEDIRNCLSIQSQTENTVPLTNRMNDYVAKASETYYVDRKYQGKNTRQGYPSDNFQKGIKQKKCFICKKIGCWSTNHSENERNRSFQKLESAKWDKNQVRQYVIEYEGLDPDDSKDYENFVNQFEYDDSDSNDDVLQNISETYSMETLGDVDGDIIVKQLQRQSIIHAFSTLYSASSKPQPTKTDIFMSNRYSSGIFMGIMIDTGAASRSTAGFDQFIALKSIQDVKLDHSRAGEAKVKFGIGKTTSLGTINVETPIGNVIFHVVPTETPFLLSLQDLDELQVKFDNLDNVLLQKGKRIPIIRAYGHPWMLLDKSKALVYKDHSMLNDYNNTCHLTEIEIKRLHRRFGHPSAGRLLKVLRRAGHQVNFKEIERLTKYCDQCQAHGRAPGRFKFTLRDDSDFNHTLYVDVLFLDGQPVVHIVDEATNFQNAKFLDNMSAEHAWDTVREAWCDTYIGPPGYIVHDPGTNFNAKEFRDNAKVLGVETIVKPVEAHQSVGHVERYHIPLRRAYDIIGREIPKLPTRMRLQMAVKAVNDTVGPNGLVPTLLVFGAYPRMSQEDAPSTSIVNRATAIKKAMAEVRKCHAARKVADALSMRNGPITSHLDKIPLNSEVIVFKEGRGWSQPCRLIGMDGQTCQVNLDGRPVNFRSTVVKPFYREKEVDDLIKSLRENSVILTSPFEKTSSEHQTITKGLRRSARLAQSNFFSFVPDLNENYLTTYFDFDDKSESSCGETYISEKEKRDREISLHLREQGIITTPGTPFAESRKKEMDDLLAKGVYEVINRHTEETSNTRIFGSRMVDEVKGKESAVSYEKSRLVIQAFNDQGKNTVLTQSPTIQRASQRLILAIAPSLRYLGAKLFLRDITQAYVQSKSKLARPIYAWPPKEMKGEFPPNTVLKIIRPLYGIPESDTHWFGTYHNHHQENLCMTTSTYDPCLLITNIPNGPLGIVGMQTDDTLILGDQNFIEKEKLELQKAKLIAKSIESLTPNNPLIFNGCKLETNENELNITLTQNGQGKSLCQIKYLSRNFKQSYIQQRARAAYIVSVCQPEATFDCSLAAQYQNPSEEQTKILNKRIAWQMDNQNRGLNFIQLVLKSAKLFVFVDGSFANNHDLSSQIGYLIVLGNETQTDDKFSLKANILHWSSTKCKRVTRAVLASELYGMVAGVDMAISISTTLDMITNQLNVNKIPVIVCTDSFSLYECIVKLGTTEEKRFMIDIMAIRQSYERRELSEIRWITGDSNPADAMTKSRSNKNLENLISTNKIDINVQGWVKRDIMVKENMKERK